MPGKPPTVAELTWIGDLKFATTLEHSSLTLDSKPWRDRLQSMRWPRRWPAA